MMFSVVSLYASVSGASYIIIILQLYILQFFCSLHFMFFASSNVTRMVQENKNMENSTH